MGIRNALGLWVLVSVCSFSSLADWNQDFAELKSEPRSYEVEGTICEEIARLDLQREMDPTRYEVVTGIAYSNGQRTIGELDVVVFDKLDKTVVQVGEVKCWQHPESGLVKAKNQRARFLANIASSGPLFFENTTSHIEYDATAFRGVTDFITIGQQGTVGVGYDRELKYSLAEVHSFTKEMVRCQARGECVAP